MVTKGIPGADEWIDHRLVISKTRIRLQPLRRHQASTELPYSLRKPKFCSAGPSTSEASSTAAPSSPDAAIDHLPRVETDTNLDLPPSTKPSLPCSNPLAYLTETFDTVNRKVLWKIMQKFGCPKQFTHIVRQLHDGVIARVTDNGAAPEAFTMTKKVKQGCVPAPTLFSLMSPIMLMDGYRGERPGSTSPTGQTANSLTTGGCIFSRMYSHLTSTNYSSPTTAFSTQPPTGTRRGVDRSEQASSR
ncbi:hypothetical protein SprV_0100091000 [Sparganum proliferum]